MRYALILHFGLAVIVPCYVVQGQTARVQLIHASPYAEAARIDVYRDGELWLDDFAYTEGTPFTDTSGVNLNDWPAGPTRLDFTWSDAADASGAFFSQTLRLAEGEGYYVVAAGDPTGRAEQPPFQLLIQPGAVSLSPFDVSPAVEAVTVVPDGPRYGRYWRGRNPEGFDGRLNSPYPETRSFGEFSGYVEAPTVIFDYDLFAEMGDVVDPPFPLYLVDDILRKRHGDVEGKRHGDGVGSVWASGVLDIEAKEWQAFINIESGLIHPQRPGDTSYLLFSVLADGTTERARPNTAHFQWINNSPYVEAEAIDVYINGFLVVDDLGYRQATPFIELPAGLQHFRAPELTVDITAADAVDNSAPHFSRAITLLFGEKYVGVIAGDPLKRDNQPQMDLFISEAWQETATDSGRVDLLFSHGIPDMTATSIGIEGEPIPLAVNLSFGEFARYSLQPVADNTLYVSRADPRDIEAFVEPQLLTRGLADSALVVLTSGFLNPPEGIASEESDLALVAALPSGGPLLRFVMHAKTPPWWQNPWVYIVGLLVFGAVALSGYQIRILRLRARERELSGLVEERTRELLEEKKKTEEQARRLVELDEAKSRFFANISHEFRTPLTLILGPIQDALATEEEPNASVPIRQLKTMRRSGLRLHNLIDQLLDLSRLEVGRLQLRARERDLIPFVRALTQSFSSLAERRNITLHFKEEEPKLVLWFDAEKMQKVITNLLSNAFKFTPDQGRISVNVGLSAGLDSVLAEIRVTDTGEGIPVGDQILIFDRFYQADTSSTRRFEGTGIGLALARELVDLHGGAISVESEVGSGSAFYVRLPLGAAHLSPESLIEAQEDDKLEDDTRQDLADSVFSLPAPEDEILEAEPAEVAVQASEDAPLILVVEDNVDVRNYLKDHLVENYRIAEAGDGIEALEQASKLVPDLVISDVMMPRMDGFELCRAIKGNAELAHVPVVLLTARASDEDMVEGLETGADDYIFKPFNAEVLLARVENLIELRRLLRQRFEGRIVLGPSEVEVSSVEAAFLENVREVVEQHMADSNFGVDWLADEVSLSPRQLQRRLRSLIKLSPAGYIRAMRLDRAAQLLEQKAGNVSEVAYSVGFQDPYYFSRLFHQTFGVPPSEFPA